MNQNTPTTPTPASTSDRASQAAHNEAFLKHAVDKSPDGMVIVRTKGAYDSSGITSVGDADGWEHTAVIYKDKQTGEYKVLELVPGKEPVGLGPEVQPHIGDQGARYFGSDNAPRSFSDFSGAYQRYEAAPPRFDNQAQAEKFIEKLKADMGTDARFSFLNGFMGGETSTSVIAKTHSNVTGKSFDNDVIDLKPIIEAIKVLAKFFGNHKTEAFIKAVTDLVEARLGAGAAKVFLDAMKSDPVSDKAKGVVKSLDERLDALDQLAGRSFHKVTPSNVFERATDSSTRVESETWRPGTRNAQQPGDAGKGDAQQPGDGKREPQQIEKADDMTGVAMLLAALLGAPLVWAQTEHTSDTTPPEDTGTDGGVEASHSEREAVASDAFGIASINDAPSQREAIDRVDSKIQAAITESDDEAAQPAIDDSQLGSQIRAALASDTESDGADDAAVEQTATDDDQDSSQEEVAHASDDEDARTDDAAQRSAADDEEDALEQEVAIASRPEDAPSDKVDVVKPVSVEAVIAQALGDQSGLAASAPVIPDDGFSFSAFPKPGVPVEVATAAMPAEQLSHEDMLDSGTPESDSTHHDAGSQDVGNAAPNKEHMVHHGDLAP